MEKNFSEHMLLELADLSESLLCTISPDGKIINVNDAWTVVLGFNHSELMGHSYLDFIHPEDAEITRQATMGVLSGLPSFKFENRYRDKQGAYRLFQWASKFDAEKNLIVSIARDVSLRKETEKKLKTTEKRYQTIVDNMFHMIGLLSPDGILLEANQAALTFGGIAPSEAIGKYFWDCYWWQISKEAQEGLKQAIASAASGKDIRYEVEVLARGVPHLIDFSLKPLFDEEGNVEFIIPEGRSLVNEREQARLVIERETFLRSIFYGAKTAIFVVDVLGEGEFRVREVNPAYVQMAKIEATALEGKNLDDLKTILSLDTITRIKENYQNVIKKQTPISYEEQITIDGKETTWVTQLVPLFDEKGIPYRVIGTSLEITEQKQLEEEKRQLDAIKSQKMESLGTLSSGIAHDFNNILSIITLATERMKMKKTPEAIAQAIETIRTATERGKEVVQQLSLFSRSEPIDLVPILVSDVFKQVNVMLRASLPKNINLEFQQQSKSLLIKGNHTNLCQALLNLAVNARDAMPDGGRLRIQSGIRELDFVKEKFNDANAQNGYAVMSVSDTGNGIPDDVCVRMFEPFFTTKPKDKGTGLGLSIVHGVLKTHGGFIEVQTKAGKGTTFNLYIPLATKTEDELQKQMNEPKAYLMLVEDEIEIINLLSEFLENEGYAVFKALDGLEAAEMYKQNKDRIDVLITDSDLPKVNGKELISQIRHINPDLPIIVVSGSLGIREVAAKTQGKIVFVEKPYSLGEILSHLEALTA